MFTFKLPRKDGFCVCKPIASETRSPNGVSTYRVFPLFSTLPLASAKKFSSESSGIASSHG